MAAPMRDSPLDGGHRGKVADPNNKTNASPASSAATPVPTTAATGGGGGTTNVTSASNFEYDDNEWDIGIGNLIIDLDADIEKTNEKASCATGTVGVGGVPPHSNNQQQQQIVANNNNINNNNNMSSTGGTGTTGGGNKGKMSSAAAAVEHSATVDKGLKMKIKRTKPGTKEAKHEIVKAPVDGTGSVQTTGVAGGVTNVVAATAAATQNGDSAAECPKSVGGAAAGANNGSKHPGGGGGAGGSKRGSSGHRRDKARDKHTTVVAADKQQQQPALAKTADVNGVLPATPAAVSGGAGPQPASVAPSSTPQQLSAATTPATVATVAVSGGSQPPVHTSQVTPQSSATSQVVPLQSTVPTVVSQPPPVVPSLTPSVLQQPPAAAADLPPQSTLLIFPVGSTPVAAVGTCVTSVQAKSMQVDVKMSPCKNANPEDNGVASVGTTSPPPAKKLKTVALVNCIGGSTPSSAVTNGTDSKQQQPSDVNDVCVGTSVGTITEPDCLGPCEPGTSVTLEGIVWHETEGGVLVVNVTWRGKTYVGTLLDCTKHDWAPPRFCDSPTSDLDARTPKGRGKRGRAAATAPANDLSNFTETRSSVHSKLRNGAKGRRGAAGSPAPPTVPAFATPRPDTNNKRKGRASETEETVASTGNGAGGKRSRSGSRGPTASPPTSPVLLECPEPNCSKKYKHINGLKYHQSHAHGGGEEDSLLDSKDAISLSENDESNAEPPSVPPSPSPEKSSPLPKPEARKEEAAAVVEPATLPAVPPQAPSPSQPQPPLPSSAPPETAATPNADKNLVKPGVLRYGPLEEPSSLPPVSHFPVGVYCNSNSASSISNSSSNSSSSNGNKPAVSSPTTLVPVGALPLTMRPVTVSQVNNAPVINIPTPPSSVKVVPILSQPLPPIQQQPLPLTPQPTPAPVVTSVTPPCVPSQEPAKLCDKYKVKIPPPPQQRTVVGITSSPLKAVQTGKLMPEIGDKNKEKSKVGMPTIQGSPLPGSPSGKKKSRKSPASSPQPELLNGGMYGMESSPLALPTPSEGREDVQSPAYSDISDDGAPVLESEVGDKGQAKIDNKKVESQPPHNLSHYGIYPFYGQPPYLVPSVPQSNVVPPQENKGKDGEKRDLSDISKDRNSGGVDKDKKDISIPVSVPNPVDFQQKLLQQQQQQQIPPPPQQPHYFPYSYVPGYPYNIDPNYPMSVMADKYMEQPEALERPKSLNEKDKIIKDIKEEKLSSETQSNKMIGSGISGSVSNSNKDMGRSIKTEPSINLKEKQIENHQILKESIEMKSQMNDKSKFSSYDTNQYLYQRQAEELRRYYLYPEQQAQQSQQLQQQQQQAQQQAQAVRRKEAPAQPLDATVSKDKGSKNSTLASPKLSSHKDKAEEKSLAEKKEQEKASKQEGVKPTMETQGPPPPTNSYAYIHHPGFMQSPHYGALPFDPNHPMYRSMNPMLVPGPYGANPYLHPQMRYHGPEDLSRGPPSAPTKALDMLQHHASQYYSSHKIHELQERALKSPTPKSSCTPQQQPTPPSCGAGPPSGGGGGGGGILPGGLVASSGATPTPGGPPTNKSSGPDSKEAPAPLRSPPPQRHVHTHHHTHVGLGYPLMPGQYATAPYGGKPLVRP